METPFGGWFSHPTPRVQILAGILVMTGCMISEDLAVRACDGDLEADGIGSATLKRRSSHWRAVPVPEELMHALDLVHRVRAFQASATGAARRLWPTTRQAAGRQVSRRMRADGIEGPEACPEAFVTATASPEAGTLRRPRPRSDTVRSPG